ncbi:putative ABC transport system ATP-binding protein [Breznakia sp. PF5-3]|uniref:ABC transporter ATP-binding protein n=1 Tax=unclassified Breznakia TaxID=2623764 RepID=UPI002405B28D|nr:MULTISPECIES: ABC transporter ATP-binding protein [unclassified Breznakia]MDF9825604.1 putative ABC transport system ATP-binding protein [Breznakia sp. PM6-1]MDF9835859.1 putative ABC transport system ATP-binding protein [Breznakia sp. PF5-3]MDF9837604.1 putative ABC transport system ATP-binding protein [Breznakia sp. PFB2-8]MDF9860015.1 putative ABC transport system ATP-binding protein [Breznakia sp. PH5-24]
MNQLELKNVCFSYTEGKPVLQNINLNFQNGKLYAITGKSGAGKTTLLSILSLLTKPSSGEILFNEQNIKDMDPYEYRSKQIGVIFQAYNLLPQLTAIENVELSMDIANMKNIDKASHAQALLEKVGLSEDEIHRPILKLSGGQQQRVAIARALSYDPTVILADEPTGNLDNDTENDILSIFKQLAYEENKCIIIVTHSNKVANVADYLYRL